MTLKEQVEGIVSKYDDSPLECDGFTRVAAFLLRMANVTHTTFVGSVSVKGESFNPHFWIRLETGEVVDYRLRMWFGDDAPHGVFVPSENGVEYLGTPTEIGATAELFDFLTRTL